jgi:hypothetical protein
MRFHPQEYHLVLLVALARQPDIMPVSAGSDQLDLPTQICFVDDSDQQFPSLPGSMP